MNEEFKFSAEFNILLANKLVELFRTKPRENNLSAEIVKSFDNMANFIEMDPVHCIELLAKWEHLNNLREV